jgi:hypothetical protein
MCLGMMNDRVRLGALDYQTIKLGMFPSEKNECCCIEDVGRPGLGNLGDRPSFI